MKRSGRRARALALREVLGKRLRTPGALEHGDRKRLARVLGVSERTLRYWSKRERSTRQGRPPHNAKVRFRTIREASRELRRQGWTSGWRTIAKAVPSVSPYLLKKYVPALKHRHQVRVLRMRAKHRVSLKVLNPGVMAGLDAFHAAGTRKDPVTSEVLKDAATLKYLGGSVGKPSEARDVVNLLKRVEETSGLPLVLATDNGVYKSADVQAYLTRRQVIWLPSRPHTPQDNGRTERAIREIREETPSTESDSAVGLACALSHTAGRLNRHRLRASQGYRTAEELTGNTRACDLVERRVFYEAARQAIRDAVKVAPSARQARAGWRQAVVETLERFGLAMQTRGDGSPAHAKAAILS